LRRAVFTLAAAGLTGALAAGLQAHPPAPQPGAPGASDDLAGLVRRYGLQPVTPPSPATNFTLPSPGGARVSLSDYQGNWVLLTFWATWCGPCRSEMPSLEILHRQRSGAGLTVLGVSVDSELAGVEPFVEQLGLTFPNLWDEAGRVGAAYRASSIPLSYLVDPVGRLVAVSRGARDWSRLTPLIDGLLELEPPGGGAQPTYRTAGPVELPQVLEPPTAEIALSEDSPEVGAPFSLEVRLRWAGTFEEYLPLPPQVELPEGVEQEGVTASTSSRDGSNLVTYRVTLRAREPGRFALDPVELRYTPRGESAPVASRLAGPTVEVVPATVLGMTPGSLALGGGAVALAALVGTGLVFRRRRAQTAAGPREESRWSELRRRLDEARGLRLRGDGRGAWLALAALEDELEKLEKLEEEAPSGGGADPARAARLEEMRYGGSPPPVEELHHLERRVERRLGALAPDPERAGREALRLSEPSRPERGLDPRPEEAR
jgi:peroxiredoxin